MASGSSYSGARLSPDTSTVSTLPFSYSRRATSRRAARKGDGCPVGIDLRPQHQRDRGSGHVSLAVQVSTRGRPDDNDAHADGADSHHQGHTAE